MDQARAAGPGLIATSDSSSEDEDQIYYSSDDEWYVPLACSMFTLSSPQES